MASNRVLDLLDSKSRALSRRHRFLRTAPCGGPPTFEHLEARRLLSVDFNGDGIVDLDDLNALTLVGDLVAGVAAPPAEAKFDLTGDSLVDTADLNRWLADAAAINGFGSPYLKGDANLDGVVDAADYITIKTHFGGATMAWGDGDFDGDGDVDHADLGLAIGGFRGAVVTPLPGDFNITGPSTAVADTTPTITWEASTSATSYDLTISTDPSGTNVVQSHSGIADTFFELTLPLGNGVYYTHVVANNDAGSTSAANHGLEFSISEATISTVYFAQTHVQKPGDPYFSLVSNRDALIKAHVVAPGSPAAPDVIATLTLGAQTLDLPLAGPATLPDSIPDGPGVVQHSFDDSFTAIIPAAWMHPDLDITVTADTASQSYNTLDIGAPTVVEMTMFDIEYFNDVTGDYPAGTLEEIEAKWPVADLVLTRVPDIVFPELVIPARGGAPAVRVASQAEYLEKTGLSFDGEQAAALAWNGALKRAGGRSGRIFLSYINIYGVPAGGQAGGFAGVGSGTGYGILHHELGHALSLPHWGDVTRYPYKGDMYGIAAPDIYNGTHAGPTWGFNLPTQTFIPPTVQPDNVSGHPAGTYKADPMQGGGTGFQEPEFLLNHFSDYSVWDAKDYLEGHVLVWNDDLNSYASWNQSDADYTNTVSNNGVQYPVVRDVDVITVMASIMGSDPDVNMVYPPIGPYEGNRIDLFDPRSASDRAEARQDYGSSQDFDVSLRIVQGGVEKIYMLPASYDSSLRTEAVNLPAADGEVTRAELLLTPDAQINGLPADPQVLYTWSPVRPDPAGFEAPPTAGSSSAITMRAITGVSTGDPVEYLFTETTGHLGATSSGWQSSPSYTDTGLQPDTQYTYKVTMRAGTYTGQASEAVSETTHSAGSAGTITYDGFASWDTNSDPGLYDASGSDKLVVVVSGEHHFPGNLSADVLNITYNGQDLNKAVEQSPDGSSHGQTTADIWYLDNPGSYAGSGTIDVSFTGNSWVVTAIGLSGTADGFGSTNNVSGASSVDLTTVGESSMVIASLGMGGLGNTATPLPGVTGNAPLTTVDALEIGRNYAGHCVGYAAVSSPSANTFSFDTTKTDVITIAAEFLAAPLMAAEAPAIDSAQQIGLQPDINSLAAAAAAESMEDLSTEHARSGGIGLESEVRYVGALLTTAVRENADDGAVGRYRCVDALAPTPVVDPGVEALLKDSRDPEKEAGRRDPRPRLALQRLGRRIWALGDRCTALANLWWGGLYNTDNGGPNECG